jgi:hypothetical protein
MDQAVSDPTTLTLKHNFIRSYQACVPCRKRKVKCDLGDPGNPSDPPCRRCRREHKDCYFQDLRTKKGDAVKPSDTGRVAKRSRSQSKLEEGRTPPPTTSTSSLSHLGDLFAHTAPANPLVPPTHSPNDSATADRILHKEVHNANEALNLLFEAAAESRSESDDGRTAHARFETQFSERDDPNTVAWRKFWCVKAGWMTDIEARRYVDLYNIHFSYTDDGSFFDSLNPLAPIISPLLKNNHNLLATTEHALANTILTISARYFQLPGIGGYSRSYAIHDRLWRYTRGLLSKLPFSGSRAVRKYGMVESLLLLTEWHARNYHFPDDDSLDEQWSSTGKYSEPVVTNP